MMPAMPAAIHLPTEIRNGYYPASVVAAIPLDRGSAYAVTAIEPTSSPDAPRFLAAEVSRSIHGFWIADDETYPSDTLADALGDMATLAAREYPRLL
jgi:hypothetical protein